MHVNWCKLSPQKSQIENYKGESTINRGTVGGRTLSVWKLRIWKIQNILERPDVQQQYKHQFYSQNRQKVQRIRSHSRASLRYMFVITYYNNTERLKYGKEEPLKTSTYALRANEQGYVRWWSSDGEGTTWFQWSKCSFPHLWKDARVVYEKSFGNTVRTLKYWAMGESVTKGDWEMSNIQRWLRQKTNSSFEYAHGFGNMTLRR